MTSVHDEQQSGPGGRSGPGGEGTDARVAATYNLADLFESVAARIPDREAVVMGDERLTYAELDDRAGRLAGHLAGVGIGPGATVGVQTENDPAHLVALLAAFKLRAVPVNVNHRYVAAELAHLYADAGLRALVVHRRFTGAAAGAAAAAGVHHAVVVDDGSPDPAADLALAGGQVDWTDALASSPAPPRDAARSGDDHYLVYTGGTTGSPKGVLWRHEDIFFAALGGGDPFQFGDWITDPAQLADRVLDIPTVSLPTPPLMHASAQWLALHQLFAGGRVVFTPHGRFDPPEVLDLVAREGVTTLVVVGDAMVQPLVAELDRRPGTYDLTGLIAVGSGGARLSPHLVDRLHAHAPHLIVVDAFGSSETGTLGSAAQGGGAGAARFSVGPQTAVLDGSLTPVAPGSGTVGLLARTGHVPLGYLGDPERTARTIVEAGGRRWVLTGDEATVADDGTVVLLGRGSSCINSGGEKVHPAEVEVACTSHPAVADAVVVGVPDERWGERVVAVVAPADPDAGGPALADLQDHCRARVARYKVPRDVVVVDAIPRTAAGKPDLRRARDLAQAALGTGPAAPPTQDDGSTT